MNYLVSYSGSAGLDSPLFRIREALGYVLFCFIFGKRWVRLPIVSCSGSAGLGCLLFRVPEALG
jgi:hypothetical protein